jgi:hypothetical protein
VRKCEENFLVTLEAFSKKMDERNIQEEEKMQEIRSDVV